MKPNNDILDRSQCTDINPCECGREYIGINSTPLNIRLREHFCNLKEVHFDESKLAKHASEEGYSFDWTNTITLQFEPNFIYMKYKGAAHVSCCNKTISQPSFDVFDILTCLVPLNR
jgi:hypothetical protein